MEVAVIQPEALAATAARAGLQNGVRTRVTFKNIGVEVLRHCEVRFCPCYINGESAIRQSNILRNVNVVIRSEERFLEVAQEPGEGIYVQAAGVELLWQDNELVCDFSDAVITREGEEPEGTEIPALLPKPQAEPQRDPEETELVPVRIRAVR